MGRSKRHSPRFHTLERYAAALGYKLNIELIPSNKKFISMSSRKTKATNSSTTNL